MIARMLFIFSVVVGLCIPLHGFAESFNVKPGAWSISMTTLIAGTPVSPEELESMPEEKRAKVEEAMKARAGRPLTITQKTCITQEKLDQDRILRALQGESQCTRKVISRTATQLVMEQSCPEPEASTSQMTLAAKTPETLSASIVRVRGDGKGKVNIDVQGYWLGASCAGLDGDD